MPRLAELFNLEVQMQITVISYGGILFEEEIMLKYAE